MKYLWIVIFVISCSTKDESFSAETIIHDGIVREYIIFFPEKYDNNINIPLMLNFHGGSGTASEHVYLSDMRSLVDKENFILVYPQGLYNVWNVSLNYDNSTKNKTDDFGFIKSMINKISSEYNVDTTRIYATGFSNGAGMAHALACVMSNKIAAIVSMGGLLYKHTSDNTNPSPKGIMSIHGTLDDSRPYDGIENYYLSIDEMHEYWININKTNPVPVVSDFESDGQPVEYYSFKNGINNTSIEHYKVYNAGHYWLEINYNGNDTNQLIWNFVSKFDTKGLIESN